MGKDKFKGREQRIRLYWLFVLVCFLFIMGMVLYVMEYTRSIISNKQAIETTYITWRANEDTLIRIKEPYYLQKNYFLVKTDIFLLEKDKYQKVDSLLEERNPYRITNLLPPYVLWKRKESDTVHIVKDSVHLRYLYKD